MDLRKLKKLIDLVEESGIAELEITEGEEKVRISKSSNLGARFRHPSRNHPAQPHPPASVISTLGLLRRRLRRRSIAGRPRGEITHGGYVLP